MHQKGLSDKHHIRIINDTAAVLLGGIAKDYNQDFGDYIGIVLGTGINQAYVEPEEAFLRDWSEYEQSGMNTLSDYWGETHSNKLWLRYKGQQTNIYLKKQIKG